MTVLERLKAAGYDPAVSLFPDSIGNAGSMECERVQIRTFFCRPRENEAAIGVTATAMTHFSDGSTRPYPDGWPRSLEASVTLYFAGDAEFHYFGNVATDLVGSDAEFRYRLLSRCIQDCKYFLGCGSRFSKYLWGCCVENHIQAMHRAYRDDLYDGAGCSGQYFTTRVRLFRRRGCWYAYHFVSVDM